MLYQRVIILMIFCLFMNGCVAPHLIDREASFSNELGVSQAKTIALAISCLAGTGVLAKPLYVRCLPVTNHVEIVEFCEAEQYNDREYQVEWEKNQTVWSSPSVSVQIGGIANFIQINGVTSSRNKLTADQVELERAVILASVWAVKINALCEGWYIMPVRDDAGRISVSFIEIPRVMGGWFSVNYFANNGIGLLRGY
jgi:hypothetical protein